MKLFGIVGLLILVISTTMLFAQAPLIGIWMTPIGWTGFILAADALVLRKTGTSLITRNFPRFLILCGCSIVFWLIFEAYNLHMDNWHYTGLPENPVIRLSGFAWAFATIWPGIFEMRELLNAFGVSQAARCPAFPVPQGVLQGLVITGLLFLIPPVFIEWEYWAPFIWTGVIFLLEPINYRLGAQSILRECSRGSATTFWQFMTAGLLCGVLWEFWNYWSTAKWVYTVPYPPDIKFFEMPLIGWLGFPPFAVECFVMWETFRRLVLDRR